MRITGGAARGIPLVVPKGDAVRPATDALRQAVFSSLGARVPGATFLDLFAGSGAYGLEALSRGAAGGTFVERNAQAAECLRRNLSAVRKSLSQAGGSGEGAASTVDAVLFEQEVLSSTWGAAAPDLVFVDPPYDVIAESIAAIFDRILALNPPADVVVVFEMPGELDLHIPGWEVRKRLGKGGRQPTAVVYLRQ